MYIYVFMYIDIDHTYLHTLQQRRDGIPPHPFNRTPIYLV